MNETAELVERRVGELAEQLEREGCTDFYLFGIVHGEGHGGVFYTAVGSLLPDDLVLSLLAARMALARVESN